MSESELKEEIINLLKNFFGDSIAETINSNYESDRPDEIIEMAYKLLSDFMGEENTNKLLNQLIGKFPDLKIKPRL